MVKKRAYFKSLLNYASQPRMGPDVKNNNYFFFFFKKNVTEIIKVISRIHNYQSNCQTSLNDLLFLSKVISV